MTVAGIQDVVNLNWICISSFNSEINMLRHVEKLQLSSQDERDRINKKNRISIQEERTSMMSLIIRLSEFAITRENYKLYI